MNTIYKIYGLKDNKHIEVGISNNLTVTKNIIKRCASEYDSITYEKYHKCSVCNYFTPLDVLENNNGKCLNCK